VAASRGETLPTRGDKGTADPAQRLPVVAWQRTGLSRPDHRHLTFAAVMALQRLAGNSAVSSVLAEPLGSIGSSGQLQLQRCGPYTDCSCGEQTNDVRVDPRPVQPTSRLGKPGGAVLRAFPHLVVVQ